MLADDIVAETEIGKVYDGFDKMQDQIRAAQKFTLSREYAHAADGLVDNISELGRVAPFCRLPYPLMWLECSSADRPHWNPSIRPIEHPAQHETSRVGFLMRQLDDNAKHWRVHLFWSVKNRHELDPDDPAINGSVIAVEIDLENAIGDDPLESMIKTRAAEFGQLAMGALFLRNPEAGKRMADLAQRDWGGELRFMVATLGLLNARNVAQTEPVDQTEHNRKRARRGRAPLFSYSVLKVRPNLIQRGLQGRAGAIEAADVRLHFVRGHFKARRTGLFWWGMHTRGRAEHGVVHKDYEL